MNLGEKIIISLISLTSNKFTISFNYQFRQHIIMALAMPVATIRNISYHFTEGADMPKYFYAHHYFEIVVILRLPPDLLR